MQERDVEIIRRSALIASRSIAEKLNGKTKLQEFEERFDAYMAILEVEFADSANIRAQTFNTYLLGFLEGALAARSMNLGRISGNRKKFEKLIERLRGADFSAIENEFE